MTKKMYALITGIVGGVGAIVTAIVSYAEPSNMVAILTSIPIVITAINEVLANFVKDAK
jgi:uncharacterized membrane protein YccC